MNYEPTLDRNYCRGYSHGTDGILYYPGPKCRDPIAYENGYRAGREKWKSLFGKYPASGTTTWDVRP